MCGLTDLVVERDWRPVRAHQNAMNLFLSVEGAAPLPVIDVVRTMADGLPSHGAGFSAIQKVIHRRPIHRSRLRFHDPEILPLEAAGQVMRQTVVGGIDVATAHVVIPRSESQRLGDLVVVESIEEPHQIPSDELTRVGMFANHINLVALVFVPCLAHEVLPLEHETRVMAPNWDRNFGPVVVALAPVSGGPVVVQVVKSFVLCF